MYWLGMDTSGLQLAVCLLGDGDVLATRTFDERRRQGEVLLGLIDEVLAAGATGLDRLDGIAVVTGPGSFTGLRLGLAAAQGLARATGCKLAGYDRFALLQAALAGRAAAIVLDSLRDELFVQIANAPPELATADDVAARWNGPWAGDGAARVLAVMPSREVIGLPRPAELAARRLAADMAAGADLPAPCPCYLRAPDVTGQPAA